MWGASDDLSPESMVLYIPGMYIGAAGRGVVMW